MVKINSTELIPGPTGLLEVLYTVPTLASDPKVLGDHLGLVCHPHPQHGGTMHNKVVYTAARAYFDLGIPHLRFNYRGVGQSEGSYDEGRGEIDDAISVLRWGLEKVPASQIFLAGFSFGALIALKMSKVVAPKHLVMIAPPLHWVERAWEFLSPDLKVTIILGERDELVPKQPVSDFVEVASKTHSMTLHEILEADHYFHGRLNEIKEIMINEVNDLK